MLIVPELLVSDLKQSLAFWCELCGFEVVYDRPEDEFALLDRDGCRVMLEGAFTPGRRWITGPLEQPFGRGLNLEIGVTDISPIVDALAAATWPLYLAPEMKWYRAGEHEAGVRQFIVQDPDGYLLRFSQKLGRRAGSV